jgi:hypothetical protein
VTVGSTINFFAGRSARRYRVATVLPTACRCRIVNFINRAYPADTGLAHHKAVPLDDFVAMLNEASEAAVSAPEAPVWDWAAANQRKIDAGRQLAPLADALDDIEARIAELVARTKDLELA